MEELESTIPEVVPETPSEQDTAKRKKAITPVSVPTSVINEYMCLTRGCEGARLRTISTKPAQCHFCKKAFTFVREIVH